MSKQTAARLGALLVPALMIIAGLMPASARAQQVVWRTQGGTFDITLAVQMYDDGATGGDATAADGLFTGTITIPADTANPTTPRIIEYEVVPPGGSLTTAMGAAGGTPMQLAFPDGGAQTVKVFYATAADPSEPLTATCTDPATVLQCEGYGPVPSISDAWNTKGTLVVAGDVQSAFGGTAWDPASTVTAFAGSGATLDLKLLSAEDHVAASSLWRVAVQGASFGAALGADGWHFGAPGATPTGYGLDGPRWQVLHFQVKPERGMARVVSETTGVALPLLTEVVTDPAGPFVEVHNAASVPLSLDRIFLTDSPAYPEQLATPAAVDPADFAVGFAPGTVLAPGAFATVSLTDAATFQSAYGVAPDAVLASLTPAFTGGVGAAPALDPVGEFVALYTAIPGEDLVHDLDIVVWGAPATADQAPVKTGATAGASTYGDDSGQVNTSPAPAASAIARRDMSEGGERSGASYNGVLDPSTGNRDDETDETVSTTWAVEASPSPGADSGGFTYVVHGTVTDASTTTALQGVTVSAAGKSATTDAAGQYQLTLPGGSVTLTASLSGYQDGTATVNLAADTTKDFALTPLPGVKVSGTVKRRDGTPIGGARVALTGGPTTGSTTTAANGTYALTGVQAGSYTVRASKAGFYTHTLPVTVGTTSDVTGVDFTLIIIPAGYDVSGHVVDATTSSPIAGATVDAAPGALSATTDSQGAFTVQLVPNGDYTLTAVAVGYAPQSLQLTVASKAISGLSIALAKKTEALTLRGQVTVKNLSLPIVGATVSLTGGSGSLSLTGTTDQTGHYLITGIHADTYDVSIAAPGYTAFTKSGLALGADTTLDAALARAPGQGFALDGVVQLSDEQTGSWGGSVVEVTGPTAARLTTDAKGHFHAVDLQPGSYRVLAAHSGYVAAQAGVTLTSDTGQDFILHPEATTSGGPLGCSGCSTGGGDGSTVALLALLAVALGRRRRASPAGR